MESRSKSKLNADELNAMVQRAFGKPMKRFHEKSDSGYFSAIYFIELSDQEVVLKVSPKDGTKILRSEINIMRSEVETLKRIKNKASIPVPEVLFYDNSRALCDSEYFFMEKISGESFRAIRDQLNDEQTSGILFEIGRINKEINEIEGVRFGSAAQPDKQTADWKSAFRHIFFDIIADGRDAEIKLPVSYEHIEDIFERFAFACDHVQEPRLIHWDLWPGNVLVENGKVTGIIDWDRTLWADPLMECFFRPEFVNHDFCSGYGIDFSKLDRNARIRRALYNLYVYLVMRVACDYRGYTTHIEWAKRKIDSACEMFTNFCF